MWWSKSQHAWLDLKDMNDFHLRAAFQRLERGEYQHPEIDLTAMDVEQLKAQFRAEFARRGLDDQGNLKEQQS